MGYNHCRFARRVASDEMTLFSPSFSGNPSVSLKDSATVTANCATGSSINLSENGTIFGFFMEDGTMKLASMANRDIVLAPNGTGKVRFGTYTAGVAGDSTGFITISDALGNARKVMIQA